MVMFKKYGVRIFALVLLAHCILIYLGMNELRTMTKLLLVPVLLSYLAANKGKANPLVYCGLIFSFLGDLILSQTGEIFFLLGMLAFVGTHVCNSIFFIGLHKGIIGKKRVELTAIFLLAAFSAIVFGELRPYLGSFQWPILTYMFIISLMAISATSTLQNPMLKPVAVRCFIPGAVLFVLSDSILAMNKFLWHKPMLDILIMLTYGGAQYFLTLGFARVQSLRET